MRRLLRPTNEYGAEALLPGDPQVALELAQALIASPLMANHARGLWGYSGAERGRPERLLSVQSTGYGGQSAAAVVDQLASLGVERALRLGTCVANGDGLELGQAVLATEAIGHDGVAHPGSGSLAEAFSEAHGAIASGAVASVDTLAAAGKSSRALAVDGATAGLFAAAAAAGVATGAVLVVVETADGELGDEPARARLVELGETAAEALGRAASESAVYVGRVKQP